ncbi:MULTISPECIES: acyl-CoA dehydrogenase family protein [Catenuloplanes]|uniref:Alkylation response protein AidB-like acyl-CoA dehydrogenase n=1 Tax=Catenuloplanes niger TaxID=587534 RepID=A0AAE3ZLY2_9ACTN|nr:acyl-CoA dehydrogenase family protein [Catenuloplanes niger]MDR7322338.1 alkylation response protein AidB-like acyl-CoA dehydrogenase [Catenuloplanes niger]
MKAGRPPTPEQREAEHHRWVTRAERVAELIDGHTRRTDGRDPAPPVAEAELLRQHGLLTLLTPAAHGGAGLTWRTALAAVRVLARADGRIGYLLGDHYVSNAAIWLAGGPRVQSLLGRPSAERQWLWSDVVVPGAAPLELIADGDGYRLTGTRLAPIGVAAADMTVVAAADAGNAEPLLVGVPRESKGVSFTPEPESGVPRPDGVTVRYDRVWIPSEHVVCSLDPDTATPRASLLGLAVQAVAGHLCLGIAEGAMRYCRSGGPGGTPPGARALAGYGTWLAALDAAGELANRVAESLSDAAARPTLTWPERADLAARVSRLPILAADLATEVTFGLYETTSDWPATAQQGFDRFWRDARAYTAGMPLDKRRREVAQHFLTGAEPARTDLA